ncbi:hypothetical protein SK571_42165 [Lentzea sp. BCCO 10_0798]|uniref:Uncharacterized protein n=1 Tax=Lentzea kristufekii TaxID=3095430 RepID=A0ABU4U732_9PSEU|nr:hypothetical protein [Lentzea sp. BCCO 10_0798]MDX8056024.1 hypothetical protein [Lentzea sp. BCCO 10_0798]
MGELWWSDVREWFAPEDGPLHDGCVAGVGPGAWLAVADLAAVRGWWSELDEGTLRVWPGEGFLVNFFEAVEDEVLFDVDVRELQGQERLDLLGAFLRELGLAFGRPVALAFEGCDPSEEPYLHYDPVADGFVLDREPG